MALASRTLKSIQSLNKSVFLVTQQKTHFLNGPISYRIPYRLYAGTVGAKREGDNATRKGRDPGAFFFNDEIQSCLLEMNMRDTAKVFQARREGQELSDPEIKFLTQEELEKVQAEATERAKFYLQLPPVLLPKDDKVEILSKDPALQGLEESKILITDISFGVPERERLIVARDPDGTLRHANREERYRMLQTYFPDDSRSVDIPQLFSSPNLKSLLERSEFEFVLDRACAQFEPDDPRYTSVTSTTYDYIDEVGKYDDLIGTRHYGTLAFYLVFNNRMDRFLRHCISTFKIEDAVGLVRVFYLTRPDLKPERLPSTPDDTEFIKAYISNHSKDKAMLSKALNAYLELNVPSAREEAALSKN